MRITSATTMGAAIRSLRTQQRLTQVELAKRAHVSRRWLSDVEAGKASAELGLILRTLDALNTVIDVQSVPRNSPIDLDALIDRLSIPPRDEP
jgi:HTH-type transcriptional regulator/antitoxin HipB